MSNAFASSIAASGGVTASAIVAPVVGSGSHFLRIDGYSCTKGICNGTHIASETFAAAGHRWCLHYYPDSPNRHDSGEISIFLKLVDADANEVKARYTISLLDHDENPRPQYIRAGQNTFSGGDTSTTGVGLIERSELERCGYLKDDAFVIRCDIIVVKEIFTKAIPVSEVFRPVVKRDI
ncbi:hypothetical protein ZWY2020_001365 [Hordeum vulgare]|nr:hypothetical protein ZWY2020_001365 [Hordeum vulgare]